MARALVVLCHPEPRSFTASWARASVAATGAELLDLHAEGFDPVERAAHYADPGAPFDVLKAQEAGPLPAEVRRHIELLKAADRLILHFPLWWFAPPAMLKGWCERVLAHGATHDTGRRFDRGRFLGHSVLFCVSTGASAAESGPDGREGDTRLLLWPLAMTFRYLGYEVLEPEVVHGVHGYHSGARLAEMEVRLQAALNGQDALIGGWEARPRIAFNADEDFDAAGRLRREAPSHSPFIRRSG